MSRTYRRNKSRDKYLIIKRYGVLHEYVGDGLYVHLDENSAEGRKKIKEFISDHGHHWMDWRGPSWFIREFCQVPYRTRCRNEISKWLKNPDHEVLIESKPPREYWL